MYDGSPYVVPRRALHGHATLCRAACSPMSASSWSGARPDHWLCAVHCRAVLCCALPLCAVPCCVVLRGQAGGPGPRPDHRLRAGGAGGLRPGPHTHHLGLLPRSVEGTCTACCVLGNAAPACMGLWTACCITRASPVAPSNIKAIPLAPTSALARPCFFTGRAMLCSTQPRAAQPDLP